MNTQRDEVRSLYERQPYPPPETDLDKYRDGKETIAGSPAHAFHLYWPGQPVRDDLRILVAGCGTSQAAKYALQSPAAQVVGIDLSQTSLGHTQKLIEKYQIRNLELKQLPVEDAATLGEAGFDLVVSTGVLHHLPDPDAGLRALRGVLKPGGAMHLMVYAPYGRAGVYMLQAYARRMGVEPETEQIKAFAKVLAALPPHHPLASFSRQADDLKFIEGIADALLHPCDRAYSVPDVYDWLGQCGLSFMRFALQAPYAGRCSQLAQTPHWEKLRNMPLHEQAPVVELFRGDMLMHSFIACRDDRPADWRVDFEGDAWRGYVPQRFPGSTIDQKNPPPGTVAVLRNSRHRWSDIAMPLTAATAHLCELIGGRTLEQIISDCKLPDEPGRERYIREFFRALWEFDQVLFRWDG